MFLLVSTFSILYLFGAVFLFIKLPKTISAFFRFIANIVLICIINIIVWQPVFSTKYIKQIDNTPVVLIDNSISMNFFDVSNSLKLLTNQLDSANIFKTYFFGKKLREGDISKTSFNDSISKLPFNFLENSNSKAIILISDALCNNLHFEKNLAYKSNLYYMPLNRVSYKGFNQFTNPSEIHQKEDQLIKLPIQIDGYSKDSSQTLNFEVTKNERVICQKVVHTPINSYSFSEIFEIPNFKTGRHLVKISMKKAGNIEQISEALIISEPKKYNIKFFNQNPCLDSRFLKLSILKRKEFDIVKSERADISIYFNILKKTPESKTNLYIANSIPNTSIIPNNKETIELNSTNLNFINFNHFPSPTSIFSSKASGHIPILNTEISKVNYPILSKSVKSKETAINLYIKGFWRWDFQEKNDLNNTSATFTNSLLDLLKENFIKSHYSKPEIILSENTNLKNTFNIYHPHTEPSGDDSVYVFHILKEKEHLIYSNSLNSYLKKDTIIFNSPKNDTSAYKIKTKYGKKRFETIKQSYKKTHNSEINSSNQNTIFLEKYFKKLDKNSIKEFKKQITLNQAFNKSETITKQIKLQRNWPLLIIAILLITFLWSYKEN